MKSLISKQYVYLTVLLRLLGQIFTLLRQLYSIRENMYSLLASSRLLANNQPQTQYFLTRDGKANRRCSIHIITYVCEHDALIHT